MSLKPESNGLKKSPKGELKPSLKVKTVEPKATILVCCPNNSGSRNEYAVNAMFSMGWFAAANGIKAASYTFDEHPISIARNAAMKMFEETMNENKDGTKTPAFTHIFFIDSDVVPPPDVLPRLLSYNVPVVAGWYLNRKGTGIPIVFKLPIGQNYLPLEQIQKNPQSFPKFQPYKLTELLTLPKDKKTGLIQVDGVGMGCILMKREILPHLSRPFFFEDPINFHGFGEDLWFSFNCKYNNIPIKLDQSSFCAHVTWGLIDMRHVQALLRREQQPQQQNTGAVKKPPML